MSEKFSTSVKDVLFSAAKIWSDLSTGVEFYVSKLPPIFSNGFSCTDSSTSAKAYLESSIGVVSISAKFIRAMSTVAASASSRLLLLVTSKLMPLH